MNSRPKMTSLSHTHTHKHIPMKWKLGNWKWRKRGRDKRLCSSSAQLPQHSNPSTFLPSSFPTAKQPSLSFCSFLRRFSTLYLLMCVYILPPSLPFLFASLPFPLCSYYSFNGARLTIHSLTLLGIRSGFMGPHPILNILPRIFISHTSYQMYKER
ncbi:MAG: hypothetical protein BYD32DRAFT_136552 [Podila humilis]|nr:MAG: hypothetical protein BYD32DRAFT_136552 [Podila humilis]